MKKIIYDSDIELTNISRSLLEGISKWTRFLSIVGFVFLGLAAIALLFSGTAMVAINEYMAMQNDYPYMHGRFGWGTIIMMLIALIVYFIPVFFLYKFSTWTKKSLSSDYKYPLNGAFRYLRNHYMMIGVLMIIWVLLFVISLIALLVGFSM